MLIQINHNCNVCVPIAFYMHIKYNQKPSVSYVDRRYAKLSEVLS